jgi:hypothetical protein
MALPKHRTFRLELTIENSHGDVVLTEPDRILHRREFPREPFSQTDWRSRLESESRQRVGRFQFWETSNS